MGGKGVFYALIPALWPRHANKQARKLQPASK